MRRWDLKQVTQALGELAPHAHQTSWVVLTGGPCAGKSTVLAELKSRGHRVIPEQALAYIRSRQKKGESISGISSNVRELTAQIFQRNQLSQQRTAPSEQIVFDRALPDVLAFSLVDELNVEMMLPACATHRFAAALVFEYVGTRDDSTIYHTTSQIREIEANCEAIYKTLAEIVIRVPAFTQDPAVSVAQRTDLVEATLQTLTATD
jgi:predicted ATPase